MKGGVCAGSVHTIGARVPAHDDFWKGLNPRVDAKRARAEVVKEARARAVPEEALQPKAYDSAVNGLCLEADGVPTTTQEARTRPVVAIVFETNTGSGGQVVGAPKRDILSSEHGDVGYF